MAPINLFRDRFFPVDAWRNGWNAYSHSTPEDVLRDRTMSVAEKRSLLASWLSDIRAVEHMPSYRQLDNGALVRLDDIREALRKLDEQPPRWRIFSTATDNRRANRAAVKPRDDDDDDPPPAPAGLGKVGWLPLWLAA